MKLTALQQQSRRNTTFRGSSPLDSSADGAIKSPAAIFWLLFHGLCCLISLVLGFRFSRLIFYLVFSTSATTSTTSLFSATTSFRNTAETLGVQSKLSSTASNLTETVTNSRVVVGRHGILIRPWPHPNIEEVMRAHKIMERVQKEQRMQYGVKNPKTIIAITPTYVRTFQALHLTGVMHSLMNVPYDLVWIVVEADGPTNETASLLEKSSLNTIHIGFNQKMPITWEDRHKLEAKMRIHGLSVVRDKMLDGIVMFADDSNMHSMELFDEIQNVKWIGAISIGILAHGAEDESFSINKEDENNPLTQLPVQGPACNASNNLTGWHTFNTEPFEDIKARFIGDRAIVLPNKLEWCGFVLNSRLVWKDTEEKPEWVNDFDYMLEKDAQNPLDLLKDSSMVEPLGNCGRKINLWWLRVEARADSKFPPRWIIDPPLDITVPAKSTPWPDAPPEVPFTEKVITTFSELPEKRSTVKLARSPKKRSSRSKKKRVPRSIDEDVFVKRSEN